MVWFYVVCDVDVEVGVVVDMLFDFVVIDLDFGVLEDVVEF